MAKSAFWDASALVPLCVHQGLTERVIALYKIYEPIVWWATPVEIASALARLARMKQITISDWNKAKKLALRVAYSCSVIQPSISLRTKATQLVDLYELRAADAFQLAAALHWSEDAPQEHVFLTADPKLRTAALRCGFDARQM